MKKNLLPIIYILFFLLLGIGNVFAQEMLTGTVKDNTGTLPGVSVQIKGTTLGAITDVNGKFSLSVPSPSTVLVFTFIGYASQERAVKGQKTLEVTLVQDAMNLSEFVVTGVVNNKSALESSVAITSIKPKSIERLGAVTTAEIFKSIPGVHSESTGGEGNANISVRGIPISTGGAKFLQLHEDGLPVMQFGDIAFGNADIFLRSDQTISRIEAIRGGSASTFASNSPAGIINFISKNGAVEGGTIGTTFGLDYKNLRTDFEYGAPIANGWRFHLGGFFRTGNGPRDAGYTANYGGQVKANLTKEFKNGYVRVYFKHLDDKAISYMPMPVMASGTGKDPNFESIPGFDAKNAALQSPEFLHILSVDGNGNSRTTNMADGMHPISNAFGTEFSFDLGEGWKITNKGRKAFNSGSFNAPFPVQIMKADALAQSIGGANYTASYAYGENAGKALTAAELTNLNGNGLLMKIATFDVQINSLDNFTNDFFLTKKFNKVNLTAGYYKANQRINMTWLWQTYTTDVQSQPRLINIASGDSSFYSEGGLTAHGIPAWGNCCTRGYDMNYTIDAPYANVGVELTDMINVDASIRYDFGDAAGYYLGNKQAAIDVNNDGTISPVEESVTVLNTSEAKPVNYNFNYVSYSLGANLKLDEAKAIYARYSKGGRANADRLLYSSFLTSAGGAIEGLDADKVSQAELGLKYNSPKIAFTVTGFYSYISEQNEEFGKTINTEFNSAGAEFETSVNLGNFNATASAIYTTAKIKKSLSETEVGNVPRRTPALMYNINPSYTYKKAVIGLSFIGTTKVYSQNDNAIVLPAYLYLNAFASYDITKGFTLSANVNNLTNTLGFTEMEGDGFVDNTTNYMRARPITGRASTLSLTYRC